MFLAVSHRNAGRFLVCRHSDSTFLCIRGRNVVCRRGITQHLFLLLTTLYIDHFSNVVWLHLRMSCSLSITFWDIINPIGTCWAVNGWVDKISLERFTYRSKRIIFYFNNLNSRPKKACMFCNLQQWLHLSVFFSGLMKKSCLQSYSLIMLSTQTESLLQC